MKSTIMNMTKTELTKTNLKSYFSLLDGELSDENGVTVSWTFTPTLVLEDNSSGVITFKIKVKSRKLKKKQLELTNFQIKRDIEATKGYFIPSFIQALAEAYLKQKGFSKTPTIQSIQSPRFSRRNEGYSKSLVKTINELRLHDYSGLSWIDILFIRSRIEDISIEDADFISKFVKDSKLKITDLDFLLFTLFPSGDRSNIVNKLKLWSFIYNGVNEETYGEFLAKGCNSPMNIAKGSFSEKESAMTRVFNTFSFNCKEKVKDLYSLTERLNSYLDDFTITDLYSIFNSGYINSDLNKLTDRELITIIKSIGANKKAKFSGHIDPKDHGDLNNVTSLTLDNFFSPAIGYEIIEIMKNHSEKDIAYFNEALSQSSIATLLWNYAYVKLDANYIIEILKNKEDLQTISEVDWLKLVNKVKKEKLNGLELSWAILMATDSIT